MKREKKDAANFQQLSAIQMQKVKGGVETITITNPDGTKTIIVL